MMTKKEAIDILIAVACCSLPALPCDICPLVDSNCKWNEDLVVEAVKFLNGNNSSIVNPTEAYQSLPKPTEMKGD